MSNMSNFAEIPLEDQPLHNTPRNPPKIVLNEHDNRSATAYAWSTKKKWTLLTIVAFCQISINASFGVFDARLGMTAFLIPYAIGCGL
jgi:hypothetical protein